MTTRNARNTVTKTWIKIPTQSANYSKLCLGKPLVGSRFKSLHQSTNVSVNISLQNKQNLNSELNGIQ